MQCAMGKQDSARIEFKHDDVIKWKHFPRYWPYVRGIHRSSVNSPHKGQWRGAVMFSLICVWINGWVNYREAGDLRRGRAHYDITVMDTFRMDILYPRYRLVLVDMAAGDVLAIGDRPSYASVLTMFSSMAKSLQLISRSGTLRWNLLVPDLQMGCIDLPPWQNTTVKHLV